MNNMKKKLVLFASVSIALASCQTTPKEDYSWIKKGLDVASAQLQLSAEEVSGTGCCHAPSVPAMTWISFAVSWKEIH